MTRGKRHNAVQSKQVYWLEIRHSLSEQRDVVSVAIWLWLTPKKDGNLQLNEVGHPIGMPLRWVARELEKRGLTNGKGKPYHPYQLQQEIIFDGLTDIIIGRSRSAVREHLEESCRQKHIYDHDA